MNLSIFAVMLLTLLLDCQGGKDKQSKNKLVEEIMKKIYNISSNAFSYVNPEEKRKTLIIVNNKLKDAAKDLGTNKDKYIDIIMQGIHMISPKYVNPIESKSNILRQKTQYDDDFEINHNQIMKRNWPKIADHIDQKNSVIHDKHGEIKPLRINVVNEDIKIKDANETRKIMIKPKNIIIGSTFDKLNHKNLDNDYNTQETIKVKNLRWLLSKQFKMVTKNDLKPLAHSTPCETVIEVSCKKLRSVNKLFCPLDRKEISINKLCDGVFDCDDGYDEQDCLAIASKKIKDMKILMTEIEKLALKQCSDTYFNNVILTTQNVVFDEILQIVLSFMNNTKKYTKKSTHIIYKDLNFVKKTVNEIALVISSLSMSIEGSICPQHTSEQNIINIYNRRNELWEYDDDDDHDSDNISNKKDITLKNCKCERGFCNESNCTTICRRVCWQKYSLRRWGCQAVTGGNNIALDRICDGKLDCHDETDEAGCARDSQTKYDALNTFAVILKMLRKKASSEEYSYVRNRLLNLYNNVKTLQELSTVYRPDPDLIKPLRDVCFAELVTIYEDVLNKDSMELTDDVHIFLLSINEKLVSALKLTHTGNNKTITLDGCYCNDHLCALSKCTRRCERVCAAEAKLIRYSCKQKDTNDVSIPIDGICNGKVDCPQGDDEMDCNREVCRAHHFLLLRYNIRGVGDKQKGTALGALLGSWKSKTISTLMIAETAAGLPTTAMMRSVITDVLRDLVATYAAYDPSIRANDYDSVLKEFTKIAQRIIKTIKTCGH